MNPPFWIKPLLRHKRKNLRRLLIALTVVYAITYVVIENWPAVTTEVVQIQDGLELGSIEWAGPAANGVSLVMVHGTPADAASWIKFSKRLGEVQIENMYAIDRLGFGRSSQGTFDKLPDHSKAIHSYLKVKGIEKPILVGHSYGGPVVLRAAVDYGDELAGIILMAGACDPYMNDPKWFRGSIDFISPLLPTAWGVGNRELYWLNRENQEMEPFLDQVRCPVVIIHGTWDSVCPYDSTIDYLNTKLVNSQEITLFEMKRHGHNVHFSAIDSLIDAIHLISHNHQSPPRADKTARITIRRSNPVNL